MAIQLQLQDASDGINTSIIDSSWSTFKDMLKYKAKAVIEVDPCIYKYRMFKV